MKIPEIIVPVNNLEEIYFIKETKCKNIYAYHSNFLKKPGHEKWAQKHPDIPPKILLTRESPLNPNS